MQYINSNKLNEIKLNKDNFYVLIDFDRTITKAESLSCWRVLYHSTLLGPNFRKIYDEIHARKMPDENDVLKSKYFEDRFREYIKLLEDFKLKDELIDNAIKETVLSFRDGAREFFSKMYELEIPVVIISCSIKNVLEKVLISNNCYYNNIKIYANYFDYNMQKNHVYNITPYNKNKIVLTDDIKNNIETRKYIVLLGDQVEDIGMVSPDKLNNTITFGFLDKDIENELEKFKSNFDVVLTDNSSFKDVLKLIL